MKKFVAKPFTATGIFIIVPFILPVICIVLSACKKSNTSSVTERLMHKWALVQQIDTVYTPTAAPLVTIYTGTGTDYMDFRTDGKLYSFINNNYDTANYTYSENNLQVYVKSHHYNISILTHETFILHDPYFTSSTVGHTATKITLRR